MNIIQKSSFQLRKYGKYICTVSTMLYRKRKNHVCNTSDAELWRTCAKNMILKEKGYTAILCFYKNNNKYVKTRKQIQVYTI